MSGDWCLLWLKDSSVNSRILVVAEGEVGPSQHTLDRTQTLFMDPDGQGGNLIYEEAASIIAEHSLLLCRQFLL